MDLIYASADRVDIGVLQSYSIDIAYGEDENNFQCTIDRDDHCCEPGYFLYMEGEEFGGIIDQIKVDTANERIVYSGRTWHGILESKVISPEEGYDYLVLDGNAHEVLQQLIEQTDLADLFAASTDPSEINIVSYQMDRYVYGYTGIKDMLREFSGKLKFGWTEGMVILSAEPVNDYSQDEQLDASQLDVTLEQNYRPPNHMLCLGSDELRNRAVIHIFTDANGGIQDYLINPDAEPVQDSDYITDESKKVLSGEQEVIEVLDYPNADVQVNYVELTSMPARWSRVCENYFIYVPDEDAEEEDAGGSYEKVVKEPMNYKLTHRKPYDWEDNCEDYYTYDDETDKYTAVKASAIYRVLTRRPGNWSSSFSKYYTETDDTYRAVSGVKNTKYIKQKKRPKDWTKNYKKYYYRYNDGVTTSYRTVSGVSYEVYKLQTRRPTDWRDRFGSYFRRATAAELREDKKKKWYAVEKTTKNAAPAWKARTYYTKINKEKAPAWKSVARYTKVEKTVAPTFRANAFYTKINDAAPVWVANTYYMETEDKITPEWGAQTYYKEVYDRYASLVQEATERLAECWRNNDLSINLATTDQIYDVGDIVGYTDNVTGMSTVQEVVKKIIKISNGDVNIEYEVK